MLSVVRSGADIIILESNQIDLIISYFEENYNYVSCNFDTAFEISKENTTIVMLTDQLKSLMKIPDFKKTIYVEIPAEKILCDLLNDEIKFNITHARMAPRIILMRTFGNTEKVIDEVVQDYDGEIGLLNYILETHNHGSAIFFTQSSISKAVNLSNLYKKAVFIDMDYCSLMKELKTHDLKYLNIGFDNKDWYELQIKIYDCNGEYMLHYQRLLKVIEHLELGLILGESWGRDAATIFLSVGIYRVRFFTFYEPKYIKKILLGLEYLEDGTRIVDLDIFYKRRKIYWSDVTEKDTTDKFSLSSKYRKEILSRMDTDSIQELLSFEKEIIEIQEK